MPTAKPPLRVKCPNCGTSVVWTKEQQWRPFCTERCRLIDLGAWADESHRIPDNSDESALEFMNETPPPPDHSTKN